MNVNFSKKSLFFGFLSLIITTIVLKLDVTYRAIILSLSYLSLVIPNLVLVYFLIKLNKKLHMGLFNIALIATFSNIISFLVTIITGMVILLASLINKTIAVQSLFESSKTEQAPAVIAIVTLTIVFVINEILGLFFAFLFSRGQKQEIEPIPVMPKVEEKAAEEKKEETVKIEPVVENKVEEVKQEK